MHPHEKLAAWQAGQKLAVAVYRASGSWPPAERYTLVAQVRRAAISIPANIAEGASRRGPREFRRFLDVARGSHAELRCLLLLAHELGYTDADVSAELTTAADLAGRLLWGLYSAISRACNT
jgi:four helix bundle protein